MRAVGARSADQPVEQMLLGVVRGSRVLGVPLNGDEVLTVGALDGFDITQDDANAIIMKARVKAGWIEEPQGEPAEAEAEEGAV